jgi:hypothetical protein
MSPNEPMMPMHEGESSSAINAVRAASGLTFLAGLWFFVSPWVYGSYTQLNSWNSWIVGAVIAIIAAIRLSAPASIPGLSWFNACLGVWAFVSPWIYGYTGNMGRFINSLCVGVAVFILAIISAKSTGRSVIHTRPTGHGV